MALNYKEMLAAVKQLASYYNLPEDVTVDIIKEAIARGYRKHITPREKDREYRFKAPKVKETSKDKDIKVRVDFNNKDEQIHLYVQRIVVAGEPEDDAREISLEDAQKRDPNILIGDTYEDEVPYDESYGEFGRNDVAQVKTVLRQKTREAQKQEVYDKYIDQVGELVMGIVDKVEDRFVLVKLDGTDALMPKSAQMPQESYREGDRIRVIITDVNRDTKGSQVLVSRADQNLVKRLFELEVPEIYQGIVEIKAISREAGERTKMAVSSHKPEVDAIGACIGPRGSRVQVVIEELKGEKIDIFEWSENVEDLIKNSLAPANIVTVIPGNDDNSLIVVVEDNQLSLAIGRKGSNVRLAVSLTNKKIDIKTTSTLDMEGVDWKSIAAENQAKLEAKKLADQIEKEHKEALLKQQREEAALAAAQAAKKAVEEEAANTVENVPLFEDVAPSAQEIIDNSKAEKEVTKKRKKKVHVVASDYVSKFEKLADAKNLKNNASNAKPSKPYHKDYRKVDEPEHKLRLKDMLKDKDLEYKEEVKPIYTEEELKEIRAQEEAEENMKYDDDVDYDEFDKYYDDEEN